MGYNGTGTNRGSGADIAHDNRGRAQPAVRTHLHAPENAFIISEPPLCIAAVLGVPAENLDARCELRAIPQANATEDTVGADANSISDGGPRVGEVGPYGDVAVRSALLEGKGVISNPKIAAYLTGNQCERLCPE